MKNILRTMEILGNLLTIATGKVIMQLLEVAQPGRVSASWRIDALRKTSDWWIKSHPTPEAFDQAYKTYEEMTTACLEHQRSIINHMWAIITGE